MKRYLKNRSTARRQLVSLALAAGLALPLHALAASVALATAPLATATTSTVKPNVMFILDDSGSMAWDFLPDWVGDDYPRSSNLALYKNAQFNGVYYNPAVTYKPPVHYNADGTLNTTTYPSIGSPWTAVRYDAFGKQTTAVLLYPNQLCPNGSAPSPSGATSACNLVGGADYYTFVPGEYCTALDLKTCTTTSASTGIYVVPATLRWCTTAELTTCQATRTSSNTFARYPKSATATVRVGTSTAANTVSQSPSTFKPVKPSCLSPLSAAELSLLRQPMSELP